MFLHEVCEQNTHKIYIRATRVRLAQGGDAQGGSGDKGEQLMGISYDAEGALKDDKRAEVACSSASAALAGVRRQAFLRFRLLRRRRSEV